MRPRTALVCVVLALLPSACTSGPTPSPVGEPPALVVHVVVDQLRADMLDRYRDAFTGVYRTLADEYDVTLLPFLLEGIALDRAMMQSDGIHPTAEAQPLILENVWPLLEPLLEHEH